MQLAEGPGDSARLSNKPSGFALVGEATSSPCYLRVKNMNLDALIEAIPSYARDLKLNFSSVVRQQTDLNEQQAWGTVVASAVSSRNPELITAIVNEAATHLSPEALDAAKGAAAIMGMNNIFYRFLHLSSNEKYRTMRAGLRMNIIRSHGIDPLDFELWSMAVSAINGCGACVDAHEKVLREKGITEEKIIAAVRIASVIHAIAVVLDAERVTQQQLATV
jgi:lipoyl-dependent peroxiredoxin subunit D